MARQQFDEMFGICAKPVLAPKPHRMQAKKNEAQHEELQEPLDANAEVASSLKKTINTKTGMLRKHAALSKEFKEKISHALEAADACSGSQMQSEEHKGGAVQALVRRASGIKAHIKAISEKSNPGKKGGWPSYETELLQPPESHHSASSRATLTDSSQTNLSITAFNTSTGSVQLKSMSTGSSYWTKQWWGRLDGSRSWNEGEPTRVCGADAATPSTAESDDSSCSTGAATPTTTENEKGACSTSHATPSGAQREGSASSADAATPSTAESDESASSSDESEASTARERSANDEKVKDLDTLLAARTNAGVAGASSSNAAAEDASSDGRRPDVSVDNVDAQEIVTLHIYDVSLDPRITAFNNFAIQMGTGAFHAGVEVYGQEWSFGVKNDGDISGVFSNLPRTNYQHIYREPLVMGRTKLSAEKVTGLIGELSKAWPSDSYNLLTNNCCHFADAFCRALGVGPTPEWTTHLAASSGWMLEAAFTMREERDKLVDAAVLAAEAAANIAAQKATPIMEKMDSFSNQEVFIDEELVESKLNDWWNQALNQARHVGSLAESALEELQKPICVDPVEEKAREMWSKTVQQIEGTFTVAGQVIEGVARPKIVMGKDVLLLTETEASDTLNANSSLMDTSGALRFNTNLLSTLANFWEQSIKMRMTSAPDRSSSHWRRSSFGEGITLDGQVATSEDRHTSPKSSRSLRAARELCLKGSPITCEHSLDEFGSDVGVEGTLPTAWRHRTGNTHGVPLLTLRPSLPRGDAPVPEDTLDDRSWKHFAQEDHINDGPPQPPPATSKHCFMVKECKLAEVGRGEGI